MSDFRQSLYRRYVSKFKVQQSNLDLTAYYAWCRQKYLPLLMEQGKDARILDLGCGSGRFMSFLVAEGYKNVQGVDISEEMIEIAKSYGCNAEVGNVFDYLEATTGHFDIIIALDFFEHFMKSELFKLVPMISSKLAENGILIIQTPNGEGIFPGKVIYGDLTHSTIFNPGSLRQLLRQFGFDEFRFFETGPVGTGPRRIARRIIWTFSKNIVRIIRMSETGSSGQIFTENLICKCIKLS